MTDLLAIGDQRKNNKVLAVNSSIYCLHSGIENETDLRVNDNKNNPKSSPLILKAQVITGNASYSSPDTFCLS